MYAWYNKNEIICLTSLNHFENIKILLKAPQETAINQACS